MIEKVYVMSQMYVQSMIDLVAENQVQKLTGESSYILISIRSEGRMPLVNCFNDKRFKESGLVASLNLEFDDVTVDSLKETYEFYKTKSYFRDSYNDFLTGEDKVPTFEKFLQGYKFFSKEQAYEIHNFIEGHKEDAPLLICQCEAGISRSSAIALSICNKFGFTKEYIHKKIRPNTDVLKIIEEAWA